MGSLDYFKLGDYNAYCDVCGFKYKASELRKRWDGAMVCHKDYEPRPAQDFIRGIKEDQSVPFSRPGATDRATTGYVQALAGATTITSASLGLDDRVLVDVMEQISGVYTAGAVTITINNTVVAGDTVIIRGTTSRGVSVSVVDNSTGTVIQIA